MCGRFDQVRVSAMPCGFGQVRVSVVCGFSQAGVSVVCGFNQVGISVVCGRFDQV